MEKLISLIVHIFMMIAGFFSAMTEKIVDFFSSMGASVDPIKAGLVIVLTFIVVTIWVFCILSKKAINYLGYVNEVYGLNIKLALIVMYVPGYITSFLIGSNKSAVKVYPWYTYVLFVLAVQEICSIVVLIYAISKAGVKDGIKAYFGMRWIGFMIVCTVYTIIYLIVFRLLIGSASRTYYY